MKYLVTIGVIFCLSACGSDNHITTDNNVAAKTAVEQRFGSDKKILELGNLLSDEADTSPNYYLWQAALELTEDLSYKLVDTNGGLLQTEKFNAGDDDKIALKIQITGNLIRSDNVKVTVISDKNLAYPENERAVKLNILKRAAQIRKKEQAS